MRTVVYALLTSAALIVPAAAQTPANRPAAPATAQTTHANEWRTSKMIGLNVYNEQNEKIGDINEMLMDKNGRIVGVVIGVGGFLGMGEHDVLVKLDQLKFMNEPVRSSGTATRNITSDTTGSNAPATTPANPAPVRPARSANEQWYPDHAVMNATKDQLKALPQFKYNG